MRLRIKRRIRTSTSEQWTLFDVDGLDEKGEPTNVGKMDIHYDPDMIYATLLLWTEFVGDLQESTVENIINDLVEEMIEPVGIPGDYCLDFFTPSLANYKFLTNLDEDEEDDEDEDDWDDEEDEKPARPGGAHWN